MELRAVATTVRNGSALSSVSGSVVVDDEVVVVGGGEVVVVVLVGGVEDEPTAGSLAAARAAEVELAAAHPVPPTPSAMMLTTTSRRCTHIRYPLTLWPIGNARLAHMIGSNEGQSDQFVRFPPAERAESRFTRAANRSLLGSTRCDSVV